MLSSFNHFIMWSLTRTCDSCQISSLFQWSCSFVAQVSLTLPIVWMLGNFPCVLSGLLSSVWFPFIFFGWLRIRHWIIFKSRKATLWSQITRHLRCLRNYFTGAMLIGFTASLRVRRYWVIFRWPIKCQK